MFCPNCEKSLHEGACFCGSCGARVGNAIQPAQKDQGAQRPLTAKELNKYHEIEKAKREEERRRANYLLLRSRFIKCSLTGIAFGLVMSSLVFTAGKSNDMLAIEPSLLPAFAFGAIMFFFLPFGLLPILDFTKRHGFLIVFTAVFLVLLIEFVIAFAIIAGAPCFISQCAKLIKARSNLNRANKRLEALSL